MRGAFRVNSRFSLNDTREEMNSKKLIGLFFSVPFADQNKSLVLTLNTGSSLTFSIQAFVELLYRQLASGIQEEIYSKEQPEGGNRLTHLMLSSAHVHIP